LDILVVGHDPSSSGGLWQVAVGLSQDPPLRLIRNRQTRAANLDTILDTNSEVLAATHCYWIGSSVSEVSGNTN